MADNVYPEKGDRLLVDPGRQMFRDVFGGQKFVQTGYTFVSSTALNITIAAGTAFANGTRIDRDVTTVVAATDTATNYIFIYYKDDLDDNVVYFEINTTDTPPAGYTATSQKIMEAVASGGVITSNTDTRTLAPLAQVRTSGSVLFDAPDFTAQLGFINPSIVGTNDTRLDISPQAIDQLGAAATQGAEDATVTFFRGTNTTGLRNITAFLGDNTATTRLSFEASTGRLALPVTGAGAGLLIGGDGLIYRSAADVLHTPDTFESEAFFQGRSGGGPGVAFRVGNDAEIHDINVADFIGIHGVAAPTAGGIAFGSGNDTRIFRGAANRLDLASGDSLRIVGGTADPTVAGQIVYHTTDNALKYYDGTVVHALRETSPHNEAIITPFHPASLGVELSALGFQTLVAQGFSLANRAMFFPFRIAKTGTYVRMFVHVSSAASGNLDLGIYDESLSRLVSTGAFAAAGVPSLKRITITSTELSPGSYYMAIAANSLSPLLRAVDIPTAAEEEYIQTLGPFQMNTAFPLPATATLATWDEGFIPIYGLSVYTDRPL